MNNVQSPEDIVHFILAEIGDFGGSVLLLEIIMSSRYLSRVYL